MTANTTQRVDVERLPSPHWARDLHGETEVFTTEEVAALLQQLAEREAECERLRQDYQESCDITRDWIAANNALSARAESAERAREAAIAMCKRIVNFSDCEMGDGDTARSEAAAFLAANGGGRED